MPKCVQTMIHVPDVQATAEWYRDKLGFTIVDLGSDGQDVIFGRLSLDGVNVLLSAGGQLSHEARREVDLFIQTDDVERDRATIPSDVEIIEPMHGTFYGMQEFIIRDLNGFWITFGQNIEASQRGIPKPPACSLSTRRR